MTKGEWGVIGNFVAVQMKDGNSYEICKVSMHDPEWKSNAQLITAAPDMYQALKRLTAYAAINPVYGICYPEGSHGYWIKKAEDALIKAEGK